jgi:hypothetical protein
MHVTIGSLNGNHDGLSAGEGQPTGKALSLLTKGGTSVSYMVVGNARFLQRSDVGNSVRLELDIQNLTLQWRGSLSVAGGFFVLRIRECEEVL